MGERIICDNRSYYRELFRDGEWWYTNSRYGLWHKFTREQLIKKINTLTHKLSQFDDDLK